MVRTFSDISKEEIIDVLNKCWMTHDGMWFYYCLNEWGIEKTNKINKAAVKALSSIYTRNRHVQHVSQRGMRRQH